MSSVPTSELAVRRWAPSLGTDARIAELSAGPYRADALLAALSSVAVHLEDSTLLIVRIAADDHESLLAAWAAAHAASIPVRVCLAIDRPTLARIEAPLLSSDRIGLLLDGVDGLTPLADVANEAIEAIRFDPTFADHALTHLRSEFILDAMLTLANHLGLCTFGPISQENGSLPASTFEFDYVVESGYGKRDATQSAGKCARWAAPRGTATRPTGVRDAFASGTDLFSR